MSKDAVQALQQHLVKVKMAHAQREHDLVEKVRELEAECARVKAEYDVAKDELQLCWSFVDQLKRENTLKWRCEERDDWKALVRSIQEDRQQLLQENASLRRRLGDGDEDDDDEEDEKREDPPVVAPPMVTSDVVVLHQLKKARLSDSKGRRCPKSSSHSLAARLLPWRTTVPKVPPLVLLV